MSSLVASTTPRCVASTTRAARQARRVVVMSLSFPKRPAFPWANASSGIASQGAEASAADVAPQASAVPPTALPSPGVTSPVLLCEGMYTSRGSGLPPEVERLAGGFTDAPEACPATGLAAWWRYQGL